MLSPGVGRLPSPSPSANLVGLKRKNMYRIPKTGDRARLMRTALVPFVFARHTTVPLLSPAYLLVHQTQLECCTYDDQSGPSDSWDCRVTVADSLAGGCPLHPA